MTPLTPRDLAELAEKYAELVAMRKREEAGLGPREDAHYREIARRYPGALKELDQLELDELERRRAALERARSGGEIETWIPIVHGYHGFMRAALYARASLRTAARDGRTIDRAEIADEASRRAGFTIETRAIDELAGDGVCRVVPLAAAWTADRMGVAIEDVARILALKPKT